MTTKNIGPGAPKIEYDEEVIKDIIYQYKKEVQPSGKINFASVWKYSQTINIDKKYKSEDLWRKNNRKTGIPNLGKQLIIDANSTKSYFIIDTQNKKQKIPNVRDTVNKLNDNEDIIEALEPLESLAIKLGEIEKEHKKTIQKLKTELKYYKDLADKQEEAIFTLARYGRSNESLVKNILNTGSTKSKLVAEALENIFINPMDFMYNETPNNKEQTDTKIVDIQQKKKQLTETYGL